MAAKADIPSLSRPNELLEKIAVPAELAVGLMAGRPELIRNAKPRPLSEAECAALYHAFAVLIETNQALVSHAANVSTFARNYQNAIKGALSAADKLADFANFRSQVDDDEE